MRGRWRPRSPPRPQPGDIARRTPRRSPPSCSPPIRCPLAPAQAPDLARGAALYAQNCASCHGGKGEGPRAAVRQARPAADRLRRPRAGARAQPVRPLSGDHPGPRRHRDAELRRAARGGPLGARLPRRHARLWRRRRRASGSGASDPAVRALVPDLAALGRADARRAGSADRRGQGRGGDRFLARQPGRSDAERRPDSLATCPRPACARASPLTPRGDRDAGEPARAVRLSRRLRAGRGGARDARRRH